MPFFAVNFRTKLKCNVDITRISKREAVVNAYFPFNKEGKIDKTRNKNNISNIQILIYRRFKYESLQLSIEIKSNGDFVLVSLFSDSDPNCPAIEPIFE